MSMVSVVMKGEKKNKEPAQSFCVDRYGEHSAPFCVLEMDGCRRADGEFSRRIYDAVERASHDVQSESSWDEEDEDEVEDERDEGEESGTNTSSISSLCPLPVPPPNPEPKTIPTVSNPNSVYRVGFSREWVEKSSKGKLAVWCQRCMCCQPPSGHICYLSFL